MSVFENYRDIICILLILKVVHFTQVLYLCILKSEFSKRFHQKNTAMQLYSCTCCFITYTIPLYKDTVPGSMLLLDHWGTGGLNWFYIQYLDYILCSLLQKETKIQLIPSFKTINNDDNGYLIQTLHLNNGHDINIKVTVSTVGRG